MAYNLIPYDDFDFPTLRMWSDDMVMPFENQKSLSISEDDVNVYIDAPLPGVDEKNIDISYDGNKLWIKGHANQKENNRKYHQKVKSEYAYYVTLPKDVDTNAEPTASYKDGMLQVAFKKGEKAQPKKIALKKNEK